ncbi:hypothetical protein [Acidaminococcus timonensis]|uniref:hypothetical protein n=1 Tax=Acidaminococcus timonensis TaxID=1871002 RepID=UPI00248B4B6D|nr:hypothetical protein [Acidaminococcus timonensis]
MDKEKMDACKQRLQEAAHWGKSKLTPQRLKKGAGCLLALAIVAGGGKFAMHKAKAEAKIQEAQAKTRMLQNMAAQQNITLVSTDAVKENIASTLGTDPSSITFQSVTLDDRKPGKDFKKDRKDKKEKEQKKNSRKYKESDKGQDGRNGFPGTQGEQDRQGQPPMIPGQNAKNNSQRPDGIPGEQGQESRQPQGFPRPQLDKEARADAFPGVYVARCEKDGMRYQFLVDAQSGQVLHGQVHKLNPIQQLLD